MYKNLILYNLVLIIAAWKFAACKNKVRNYDIEVQWNEGGKNIVYYFIYNILLACKITKKQGKKLQTRYLKIILKS